MERVMSRYIDYRNKVLSENAELKAEYDFLLRETNEEVIRNMSTEELADYLFERGNCQEYCYGICAYQDECEGDQDENFCKKQIVKWLKSPVHLTH